MANKNRPLWSTKKNVHDGYVVVNSQTILQNEGEVLLPVPERQRNPNSENSSGWGMQTYIMSAGIIKRSNAIFSFSADNSFEIFHPDSLEKRLQHLPITPDKDHLVVSDGLSEIKQWRKLNMMKGFFSSLWSDWKFCIHGVGFALPAGDKSHGMRAGRWSLFDSNRKGTGFHVLLSSQRVSGYKQRRSCWDLCSTSSLRNLSALMEGMIPQYRSGQRAKLAGAFCHQHLIYKSAATKPEYSVFFNHLLIMESLKTGENTSGPTTVFKEWFQ